MTMAFPAPGHSRMQRIPIATVGAMAMSAIDAVLAHYLPGGTKRGDEYVVRNPTRHDRTASSFSINLRSGKWGDFATGDKGGDLVSLVAYLTDRNQGEAADELANWLNIAIPNDQFIAAKAVRAEVREHSMDLHHIQPIPDDAPLRPTHHPNLGRPSTMWTYRDFLGRPLFHICRFNETDGSKQVLPLSLWRTGEGLQWRWKAVPILRPLYGLQQLHARPLDTVLVCEGEKAADAAQRLLPTYVCMTSPGGANSAEKADWTPLKDRRVVIWPDADAAGAAYAQAVSRLAQSAGATSVVTIEPCKLSADAVPTSFDAADFEKRGDARSYLHAAIATADAMIPHVSIPVGFQWSTPKPIINELRPVPAFDAEILLPTVLRGWVMDEAERMPCPPDFIAVAALVALGSIVGSRCAIKPKSKDNWLIVPNLWGGIVGEPSAKKTPASNAGMKPMDRLISSAMKVHTADMAEYQTQLMVFEARTDAYKTKIKTATRSASKGEPEVIAKEFQSHLNQQPAAPKPRRYKTNDSTVEKLGELLRDNPTGLLVQRDELVGLLQSWEKEGREGDRTFFLEAWNGNQHFDTDRIGRGHIRIENVCLSIFGGIQPDKLLGYLEQASHALGNDGMLQRFQLLVYPDARRWEWRDSAPDREAREVAFAAFEFLADFDPVALGAAPSDEIAKFPHFSFSEGAQELFIAWNRDLECTRIPNEPEPIIRQHLSKFPKLLGALALLFHLLDAANQGVRGPVSREAVLRAAAWCEHLEAHARRCYGLVKDEGIGAAESLSVRLKRGELTDGFTARDVRRHQWRGLTTDERIRAALDWLEGEGWIRASDVAGAQGGRPTKRYAINPLIKVSADRSET